MRRSTRLMCMYAMGVALFVALTMCVQAPVFENYYLCLGYVVMAVYCCAFGPAGGVLTGAMGVVIYCLLTSGLRGMPGWALGNVVIGAVLCWTFRRTKGMRSALLRQGINAVAVVAATAAGILLVKSGVECVLYGQPLLVRAAKNSYAFVADAVVLLVSLPVCDRLDSRLGRYMEGKA